MTVPTKDLHGELAVTAYTVVHEFISDNVKLGHPEIIFIHGKGSGKLKNAVHEILKKDKRVKEFYLDPWNIGQTIVHLNTKKIPKFSNEVQQVDI